MTEEIRKAVIQAIGERFGLPVYGQRAPQGGKRPCFTVELKGEEQKRLLGRRAKRKATVEIRYFRGEGARTAAEGLAAAEGLQEALRIIGGEEKFAAEGMRQEKTADGIRLTVEYGYHILFTEEEALMGRLAYNGKEAVGYEEKDEIQQGAAMQEQDLRLRA